MLEYQNVIDFITSLLYIIAPISIAFIVVERITNFFLDFIEGKRVNL